MVARVIAVEPFDIVVFGATGDLAVRKLIPALYHRFADGQMPEAARVIGASRRAMSDEAFRALAEEAIVAHVAATDRTPDLIARFLAMLSYVAMDADPAGERAAAALAARPV